MDHLQVLDIIRAGETGIGINTLLLMYLTYLSRQIMKRTDNHEVRITALELHTKLK